VPRVRPRALDPLPRDRLLIATGNAGKLEEFKQLLEPLSIDIISADDQVLRPEGPLPHVEETADDFIGNALLKAASACRHSGLSSLADDSGLAVDALDGAPGVHSARYAGPDADPQRNLELLLENLAEVDNDARQAAFHCAIVLCGPLAEGPGCKRTDDGLAWRAFVGSVEGRILRQAVGDGGFGYDPIFHHDGLGLSFAEASPTAKHATSHRGRAFERLGACVLALQDGRSRGEAPLFVRRIGLQAMAAALDGVLRQGLRYADKALETALGDRPMLGARERLAVSEVVWYALRNLGRLALARAALLGEAGPPSTIDPRTLPPSDAALLAALVLADLDPNGAPLQHRGGAGDSALDALAGRDKGLDDLLPQDRKRLARALRAAGSRLNADDGVAAQALLLGHHPDFVQACREQLGPEHATAALGYQDHKGPLTARINPASGDRDRLAATLLDLGVRSAPAPDLAHALLCLRNTRITALPGFAAGEFEIQDAGSQAIAAAVQARPGERVADWCAGAGGKTLALAAQMGGRGVLVALDVHRGRLAECKRRLLRAGVDQVVVRHHADRVRGNEPKKGFDAVLVDAPCSSSGALRRTPELRWHLDGDWLGRFPDQQLAILRQAAGRVRRGGRLIYATCSILNAENEEVVRRFLADASGWQLVDERRQGPADASYMATGPLPAVGPDGFYHATLVHTHD
jgi:non-canonical purine NTP pyrophosphatase (RdgB/HAM1 family)